MAASLFQAFRVKLLNVTSSVSTIALEVADLRDQFDTLEAILLPSQATAVDGAAADRSAPAPASAFPDIGDADVPATDGDPRPVAAAVVGACDHASVQALDAPAAHQGLPLQAAPSHLPTAAGPSTPPPAAELSVLDLLLAAPAQWARLAPAGAAPVSGIATAANLRDGASGRAAPVLATDGGLSDPEHLPPNQMLAPSNDKVAGAAGGSGPAVGAGGGVGSADEDADECLCFIARRHADGKPGYVMCSDELEADENLPVEEADMDATQIWSALLSDTECVDTQREVFGAHAEMFLEPDPEQLLLPCVPSNDEEAAPDSISEDDDDDDGAEEDDDDAGGDEELGADMLPIIEPRREAVEQQRQRRRENDAPGVQQRMEAAVAALASVIASAMAAAGNREAQCAEQAAKMASRLLSQRVTMALTMANMLKVEEASAAAQTIVKETAEQVDAMRASWRDTRLPQLAAKARGWWKAGQNPGKVARWRRELTHRLARLAELVEKMVVTHINSVAGFIRDKQRCMGNLQVTVDAIAEDEEKLRVGALPACPDKPPKAARNHEAPCATGGDKFKDLDEEKSSDDDEEDDEDDSFIDDANAEAEPGGDEAQGPGVSPSTPGPSRARQRTQVLVYKCREAVSPDQQMPQSFATPPVQLQPAPAAAPAEGSPIAYAGIGGDEHGVGSRPVDSHPDDFMAVDEQAPQSLATPAMQQGPQPLPAIASAEGQLVALGGIDEGEPGAGGTSAQDLMATDDAPGCWPVVAADAAPGLSPTRAADEAPGSSPAVAAGEAPEVVAGLVAAGPQGAVLRAASSAGGTGRKRRVRLPHTLFNDDDISDTDNGEPPSGAFPRVMMELYNLPTQLAAKTCAEWCAAGPGWHRLFVVRLVRAQTGGLWDILFMNKTRRQVCAASLRPIPAPASTPPDPAWLDPAWLDPANRHKQACMMEVRLQQDRDVTWRPSVVLRFYTAHKTSWRLQRLGRVAPHSAGDPVTLPRPQDNCAAAAKEPRTSEHRVIIGSALPGDNDAAGRVDVLTAQRVLAAACAQPSSSSQRTGDLMLRPALVFHPADQRWERCSKDWGYFRTVLAVDAKRRDHRLVQRMSLAGESLSPACKLAMVARTMARRPTSAIPMARSVVGEPATKAGFAIAERPGRLPARQQGHRGCRKRAGRKQQGGAGIQGPGGKRKLSPGSGADGAPLAKRQREEVSAGADVRPGGAVGRTGPPQRPPTAASGAKLTKQKQRDVRNEELRDVGKRRKRGLHASVQPVHGAGDDVPLDDEQPNGLRVAPMFATHLKAHQKAGLGFLWRNIVDGSNLQAQAVAGQPSSATLYSASDEACGAILAHSMGLGKSLTSIAFIHTFCRLFTGRVLVVVPTNVLNNWFQEFTMWLPGQTDNDGKSITATLDQAAGKKLKVFKSESAVQLSSHVKLWASAESAVLLMTPGCFMNVVLTSRGKAKPGTKGHPLKKGRAGPIDAQAEHPAAAAEPAAARAGAPAPPAATAATAAPAASARAPVGMPSEAAARTGAAGTSGGGAAAAACAAHREPGAAADGVLPGVQPPERTPDQQATAQVAPGLKGDGHQVRDALLSQCAIIIVDEAHEMRNKGGRLCKAMQKVQTLRRAALTGFPLQNNLNEYYSMLEWVRQGFISAAEFQADFVLPIKAGQASGASQDDRRGAREQLSLLNEFTESFIHRVGPELLQATLPRKTESVVLLKVADMQLNIYQELLKGLKRCTIIEDFHLLSRLLNNPHKFEELLKAEPERLCELMEGQAQEVREQARSEDEAEVEPGTATPAPPTPSGAQQGGAAAHGAAANARKAHMVNVFQELGALVEARRAELRATCGSSNSAGAVDVWGPSPKLEFIKSILRYCLDHGEKLVIFAQALPTLDSVEARVLQPLGLKSSESYYRIDGNVPPKKRADFIKNFNDPTKDVRVMLLGTKSGSLGINLTSAQRLVLLDVPWNPVFNAQAIARVFRIGQVKPTFVYRLVYAGTVEERVYRLSIDKEKLFNSVVDKKATRTVDNADASYYDYHPPVKQTRQLLEVCLSGRSPGHAHEDAALQLVARDDALLDMVADCYSHDSRLAEDPVGNLSKLELRTVAAKYMERCPQELEGHNTRHKQLWRQLQRLLDKDDEMVVESRSAAKAVAASSPEGASPAVPLACPGVPDAPLAAAALHQGQVAPAAQPSATHTHVPPNRTLEQVVQAALRDAAAPLPSDATARQAGALPISSRNPSAVATSKQARASSASHTAQPAAAASVAVPAVTAPRDAQPRSGVAPPACRTPALPAAPFPQPRGLPHVGAGPAAEPHADVCRHSAAPAAAAPPAHGDPPAPPSRTAAPASTPPPVGAASPPGAPPASQRAQAPHVAAPRPSATRRITPVAVTPSRHTQSAPGVVVPTQAHISSAVAAMDRPGATCAARPAPAAAGARPPGAVAQSPASARVPPPAAAAAATTSAAAAADRSPCAPAAVTPLSSAAAGRAPGVLSASPSSRGAPGTATPRPRKVHSTKGNGLPHADPAVPALQHVVVPPPAAPPARRFGQPPETAAVPAGPDSAAAATPLLVNATAAAPGGTAPAPPGGTRPGGALPNGSPAPLTSTAPLASTAAPPPAQGGLPTGTAPRPTSGHPQEPVTGIATTVTVADASKGSADRAAVAAMAAVNPSMENTGDGVPAAAAAHAASAAAPVGAQPLSMPSGRSGPSSQGKGSAALPKLGAPLARHHLAKRCSTAVPPMDEDWMRPGRDAAAAQVAGPTSAPPAATAIPGVVTSTLAPAQHAAEPPATHHTDFSFVTHAPPAALPAIVPAASLGPLPAIKLSPGGPAAPAGPIGALSGAPAAPQGPPQPRLGARLGLRSGGQHEEQRTADFTVPAPPHQSSAAGEPSGKQAPTSVAPELPVVTSAVPDATPAATCAGAAVQHLDGVMSNNVVDLTLDDE